VQFVIEFQHLHTEPPQELNNNKKFMSTSHKMTLIQVVDLGVELGLLVSLAFFHYR